MPTKNYIETSDFVDWIRKIDARQDFVTKHFDDRLDRLEEKFTKQIANLHEKINESTDGIKSKIDDRNVYLKESDITSIKNEVRMEMVKYWFPKIVSLVGFIVMTLSALTAWIINIIRSL